MSKAIEARTYEEALAWLRDHGFDVTEAPGTNGRVFLRKYNVSAAIQKTPEDGVKIFAYPGYLIGSEISKLVNRGYQQFLKNSKTEVPATADHLKALQSFAEELKVALGLPSLYNESLGTVSDSYHYDRLKDDDKAPVDRPKRPWEVAGKAVGLKPWLPRRAARKSLGSIAPKSSRSFSCSCETGALWFARSGGLHAQSVRPLLLLSSFRSFSVMPLRSVLRAQARQPAMARKAPSSMCCACSRRRGTGTIWKASWRATGILRS